MVGSTNLQTTEATSRHGQERRKSEMKGTEQLIHVRVTGRSRWRRSGSSGKTGEMKADVQRRKSQTTAETRHHPPQSHRNEREVPKLINTALIYGRHFGTTCTPTECTKTGTSAFFVRKKGSCSIKLVSPLPST